MELYNSKNQEDEIMIKERAQLLFVVIKTKLSSLIAKGRAANILKTELRIKSI